MTTDRLLPCRDALDAMANAIRIRKALGHDDDLSLAQAALAALNHLNAPPTAAEIERVAVAIYNQRTGASIKGWAGAHPNYAAPYVEEAKAAIEALRKGEL